MARGWLKGFERPPLWAVIVMVIGVVGLATGLVFSAGRGTSSATEPLPTVAAAPTTKSVTGVLVYGDSYTGGTTLGGTDDKNWTVLVGKKLGVRVVADAAGGGGYVQVSPFTHGTFTNLIAADPPTGANVVVIFGSRNDAGLDPAAVGRAAAADYATIKKDDPTAKLLVIGPCWDDRTPPAGAFTARDAVKAAAVAAGATFLDPLAAHWFLGRSDLIGSDGVHPTDAGHAYLAEKIGPAIEAALR